MSAKSVATIEKPMLSVADAARVLGVGERIVWTMIKDGELPSYLVRSRRRIAASDIDEYLKRHREL